MSNKKAFVGTVLIKNKGQAFGTTRQVNASSRAIARKILKKKFDFKGNVVTVPKLSLVSKIKARGYY